MIPRLWRLTWNHRAAAARRLLGAVLSPFAAVSLMAALPAPSAAAPIKIILVGDSTTAQNTGWGGSFCARQVQSAVSCLPLGRGGRSTVTYRSDGSWDLALAEAQVQGYDARYMVIQLGQNDSGTAVTDGSYAAALEGFVLEARKVGARPILMTPLATRRFVDGKLSDTMQSRAGAVRGVAARLKVPVVDLDAASAALYSQMGAAAVADIGFGRAEGKKDFVHFNSSGAELISGLVARQLVVAEPSLAKYLR